MQAPITSSFESVIIKASDGKRYLLTPNKARSHEEFSGGHRILFTFQYRRCDERGKIIPHVRQSKKNRLRARRA